MRALLLTAIGLAGCLKQNPDFCPAHPDDPRCDGTASDGGADSATPMDADVDAAPACVGAGVFEVCPIGAATTAKTLSGTLDTDGTMCHNAQLWRGSGQTGSCFIVGTNVTVQNLVVTGSRPLVIVATGELNVTGHLDASSHVAPAKTGPGQPATPCGSYAVTPSDATGAGGGAGASFASTGSVAGNGGTGNQGGAAAGTAYAPFLVVPPGLLRGGCSGQKGGTGQGNGADGGRGGGAVYLVAGTRITLGASSIVNVSGAGAPTAGKSAGGGGGGSGGMLLLHAPMFAITTGAKLVANGGGGSSGGDTTGAGAGNAGSDPDPTNPTAPAPGGATVGGAGGAGFALGAPADNGKNGAVNGAAGGGGGGGGGYIQSNVALTNATASPSVNVLP